MKVELKVSMDLINQKNKVIKKNCIVRYLLDTDDIQYPQEVLNSKGGVVKNRCRIYVKGLDTLVVSHGYEYIKNLINSKEIKGFKR